jgi:hypothetical protein
MYVYNAVLYIYCTYILHMYIQAYEAPLSAPQLYKALYNIAQDILHMHTFLNMSCFQLQQYCRGNMLMWYSAMHFWACWSARLSVISCRFLVAAKHFISPLQHSPLPPLALGNWLSKLETTILMSVYVYEHTSACAYHISMEHVHKALSCSGSYLQQAVEDFLGCYWALAS